MRKHRCCNCARYEPKERDGHCISEYDIRTDIDDPEFYHCSEWVAAKHRPSMALRAGIRDLRFMLGLRIKIDDKHFQPYLTDEAETMIRGIIMMFERGLKK